MIQLRKLTPEAYQSECPHGIASFGDEEVAFVAGAAKLSGRKRSRILLHDNQASPLHSMIVGYCAGSYIRPNRHAKKDESVLVVSGTCTAAFFDDAGNVARAVILSGIDGLFAARYVRIPAWSWHTIVPHTDCVLLEATPGPFDPKDTEYAPWAPMETSRDVGRFQVHLLDGLEKIAMDSSPGVIPMAKQAENVFRATDDVVSFGVVQFDLVRDAIGRGAERCRVLAHKSEDDRLQEMLLAFSASAYIRPSRHTTEEGLYVVSGEGRYTFFDDNGDVLKVVRLGAGHAEFCRVPAGIYHTLLPDSPMTVLESVQGPWNKSNTEYAPWAPERDAGAWVTGLRERIGGVV